MRTPRRRHTTAAASLVAAIALITGCGGSGHSNAPQSASSLTSSGWPSALDNTKIADLYNTANDSSQIVDCASAAQQAKLGVPADAAKVDRAGPSNGGPAQAEIVECSFGSDTKGATVFLGPVGASTWSSSSYLNPSAIHPASVVAGSGRLNLPYTQPDGWRWRISYGYSGLPEGTALALAHAVADQLAAH